MSKPVRFSFAARRFGSRHQRLFVPQETTVELAFLQTLERPHAIMRVVAPSL